MKNLKIILNKLTAAIAPPTPTPAPGAGPNILLPNDGRPQGKCPGTTGKVLGVLLENEPVGNPTRPPISILEKDNWRILWANIQRKKIDAYFNGVGKAIRDCGGKSGCARAESFGDCFENAHDKLLDKLRNRDYLASADLPADDSATAIERFIMEPIDPSVEPNAPIQQNPPSDRKPMSPGDVRNCGIRRDKCLCDFYEKQAEFEAKSAHQEMLYKYGCQPYIVPLGAREDAIPDLVRGFKDRLDRECANIKKAVGFDPAAGPCKKKPDGKLQYPACKELCEKCVEGEQISPQQIEDETFG